MYSVPTRSIFSLLPRERGDVGLRPPAVRGSVWDRHLVGATKPAA